MIQMHQRDDKALMKGSGALPDRARPLVMRGPPGGWPALSQSMEGAACVSEEGQSFKTETKKLQ